MPDKTTTITMNDDCTGELIADHWQAPFRIDGTSITITACSDPPEPNQNFCFAAVVANGAIVYPNAHVWFPENMPEEDTNWNAIVIQLVITPLERWGEENVRRLICVG